MADAWPRGLGIIWLSVGVALLLNVVGAAAPADAWWSHARPEWVPLVLLYWSLALPHRVGLFTAFLCGLLLDAQSRVILGEHAIALTLIIYLNQRFCWQLRSFPVSQQALAICVFMIIYQLQLFWIDGVTGSRALDAWRWLPVLTSTLLWPLVYIVLRSLRLRYKLR